MKSTVSRKSRKCNYLTGKVIKFHNSRSQVVSCKCYFKLVYYYRYVPLCFEHTILGRI